MQRAWSALANSLIYKITEAISRAQTFAVDGLPVHMLLDQAPGLTPDALHVTAPPGYIAIPATATLREPECVTVLIVPEGLS